jgi:hypothetical protein
VPAEKSQHSLPGIRRCFRIVDFWSRIVEEGMIRVVSYDLDWQVVLLRGLPQRINLLRIDPTVLISRYEKRWCIQLS